MGESTKAQAGAALLAAGQFEEALRMLSQAVGEDPGSAGVRANRSVALRNLNLFAEALAEASRAIELDPQCGPAWNSLGMIAEDTGNFEQAVECYRAALEYLGDSQQVHLNYAYSLMRLERFEEAWPSWEFARYGTAWCAPPGLRVWQPGDDLEGKRLLVVSEGGYGDGIMCARWFQELDERMWLSVLVWDPLAPLFFADYFPRWWHRVIRHSETIRTEDFDFCTSMLSLPHVMGVRQAGDIPRFGNYIYVPPREVGHWRRKLPEHTVPFVGVCWRAEENSVSRKHRSIPVERFDVLLREDAQFFSLCPGVAAPARMQDHTRGFSSWAETAAFLANLDMVITVDTAVAHLAGAMGIPTWIILPRRSDWKWLTPPSNPVGPDGAGEGSVWYPGARLFRQLDPVDWRPVLKEVKSAFEKEEFR